MYPVASIQVSLQLMYNRNQDNDFDELCKTEFLLILFLCFCFHGIVQHGLKFNFNQQAIGKSNFEHPSNKKEI